MNRAPGGRRSFRFPWRSRRQIASEIHEELRFHLDQRREELEAEGHSTDEARRLALKEFGDLGDTRRQLERIDRSTEIRDRGFRWLDELRQDGRFAWRTLRRSPMFAILSVLVLGLAIGANTTIFTVVNSMLLKPLMIERGDELRGVYLKSTVETDDYGMISYPDYVDLRSRTRSFSTLSAFVPTILGITDGGTTRQGFSLVVSANYFDLFGIPMAKGRGFTAAEERPHSNIPVAVISHSFWQRHGRRHDLGDLVEINGQQVMIVGITARGFTGTTAILAPDVWLPLGMYGTTVNDFLATSQVDLADRSERALMLFGRLAPGVDDSPAQAELASVAQSLAEDYPESFRDWTLTTAELSRMGISNRPGNDVPIFVGSGTLMLMAALVLLVACLNLANMMLARGSGRRTEIALRQSLGGSRRRILRQLLTEGLLLALAGGVLGLLLALLGTRALTHSLTPLLPFGELQIELGLDPRILAATLAFAVGSTLVFALGPALRTVKVDLLQDLKESSNDLTLLGPHSRPRNLLVVAQIALSLGLLTAAGLFVRGAWRAAEADPGFDLDSGLLAQVDGTYGGHDPTQVRASVGEVVARLRAHPAVQAVSIASNVPFSSVSESSGVFLGPVAEDDETEIEPELFVIGSDYFRSLGLRLLRGREFSALEETSADGAAVAIVSSELAESLWPDEDPLGRSLWIVVGKNGLREEVEVVGVAPAIRQQLLSGSSTHLYRPYGQQFRAQLYLHVLPTEGAGKSPDLVEDLREAILASEARLPLLSFKPLTALRDENLQLWLLRTAANLFILFGSVALFLAAVGVYAVKAYTVARRTREFGIRMALGAMPRDVLKMVLREGLWLTGIGIGLGLLVAVGIGRMVSSVLFEVSSLDPVAFTVAPLVLLAAALLASWLPARRATRVAPTAALRHE